MMTKLNDISTKYHVKTNIKPDKEARQGDQIENHMSDQIELLRLSKIL